MEELNSYFGMARNDYLYAKAGMEFSETLGNYNNVASGCAQAAEKYLKAVVQYGFDESNRTVNLLKSHNLRAIYNVIITRYPLSVSSRDCKWLGDFYFDARYPGDNFCLVNREDAEECLQIVEELERDVARILRETEQEREDKRKRMAELKAF